MFQFDARTVQPAVSLEPVPEGWYKVIIRKSNMKPVREKPNESYLELLMEITEGQYQGRVLYWNLNIFNSSQQAVEIAYKQLSAICHVVGQYQVAGQNAQDNVCPMLHNIPFYAHAVIAQGQRGPINNIRGVKDIYGNDPGKTGGAMPQQPGQPGPGFGQPSPGGWGGQPAAPAPQGWQGGMAGGTAPGAFTPPAPPAPAAPAPGQPAQWAAPGQQPTYPPQGGPTMPASYVAPAAPGPQQWQTPTNPAAPAPGPQAPQGGWTTGAPATPPQQPPGPPQGQPQYQQPQQPPQQQPQYQQPQGQPQQGYAPAPNSGQAPQPGQTWQPPQGGGPAGAAPWQR